MPQMPKRSDNLEHNTYEIQQNQDNRYNDIAISIVVNLKSNVVVYSDKGSFCTMVRAIRRLEDFTKVIIIDVVGKLLCHNFFLWPEISDI